MYLSRILLPWHPGQNPYNWHQQLWQLFPDESARRNQVKVINKSDGAIETHFPAYFLFRVEDCTPGQSTRIMVQSPEKPVEVKNIKIMQGPNEITYKHINVGMSVRFILTANPTKMKSSDRNRVPHIGESNLINWLKSKVQLFARLDENVLITPGHPIYFRKGNSAGKIIPATFEGTMEIADIIEFKQVVNTGIGPAKAFGCGLLLVKPV